MFKLSGFVGFYHQLGYSSLLVGVGLLPTLSTMGLEYLSVSVGFGDVLSVPMCVASYLVFSQGVVSILSLHYGEK